MHAEATPFRKLQNMVKAHRCLRVLIYQAIVAAEVTPFSLHLASMRTANALRYLYCIDEGVGNVVTGEKHHCVRTRLKLSPRPSPLRYTSRT